MRLVTRVAYLNLNGFEYSKHGSWPRAKLGGNNETQKQAFFHKGVKLIKFKANFNSNPGKGCNYWEEVLWSI